MNTEAIKSTKLEQININQGKHYGKLPGISPITIYNLWQRKDDIHSIQYLLKFEQLLLK